VHRFAFVAYGLGNRNNPDVMLGELAEIVFLLEGLSEKPAIAVHDDVVKALFTIAGALDHLLKDGSAVISGGSTGFDELRGHGEAVSTAPGVQLRPLIGNRNIVLSLAARLDAHVQRGARG